MLRSISGLSAPKPTILFQSPVLSELETPFVISNFRFKRWLSLSDTSFLISSFSDEVRQLSVEQSVFCVCLLITGDVLFCVSTAEISSESSVLVLSELLLCPYSISCVFLRRECKYFSCVSILDCKCL